MQKLAALGAWRYSQGIYRYDTNVYNELINTIPSGEMPTEVLFRLPEWCVYIETPNRTWEGTPLYGFFAHLEYDVGTARPELRFLLDTASGLIGFPLHIGKWTITEAVNRVINESKKQASSHYIDARLDSATEIISIDMYGLVSLLLYLCSDEPDIADDRVPGSYPERPKPKKTKKGWRMFPAEKPRVWKIGETLGEQLRSDLSASDGTRTIMPHLRKAHWHGFWAGPRDGERRFHYKWLPPIFVQGRKNDTGTDEGA